MVTQGVPADRGLQGILESRFQADPVADAEKEKSYAKNRLQPAERAIDFDGGLVISDSGYSYPVLIYDVSRADINHSRLKALELLQTYTQP